MIIYNIMVEFWDRLVYIPVIFFAPLLYHFSIEFCKIRTKWQKILLYISYFLAFIFIILSRTDYFVKGVFNYKWGCHTIAQTAHHFWLLFTTIFIMLTFFNILKKIKDKSTPPLLKEQSFYVFLALFFYSLNISAAFPAYKIGIYPIGYLGLPLFTFILAYAITEKNLFPQVLATDILIAAILIFLFTLLIFPEIEFNFSSRLVFFILVSLLCILLLRSVHQEAKRRIEIENMAIRERKLRQDAEKLNEEFKRLDDAKTQFLLATQHHLRTPLTVMRGYLDLIFEGSYGKVPKELKEALDKFQLSVFRLIKIVNELLDVSQFQLGKEIVYLQDNVDLKEILDEVYEELKYEAIQKDIYFNIELPKDNLPKIKADPEKLKVALFNLTDNAIKYTNKGGVCIKVDVLDNKVLICIKDTGIGIEKERLPNLFNQIFERGRDAKKSYALGRGIGLFVSSKIIEGHKGKIWAESEGKGKGSTFYVELPIG
ncbi:MAG TPA: ATP-binding protein [Candidatus Pacearchaeota archaeon]|nr:ATP-binding protein [Candidatus Pacearchaeota archaeon]